MCLATPNVAGYCSIRDTRSIGLRSDDRTGNGQITFVADDDRKTANPPIPVLCDGLLYNP